MYRHSHSQEHRSVLPTVLLGITSENSLNITVLVLHPHLPTPAPTHKPSWAGLSLLPHLHGVDAALCNGPSQRTSHEPLMDPQHFLVSTNEPLDLWKPKHTDIEAP